MSEPRTTVVAAIIERAGRILICRRSSRDSHPLKWEFPGGKVEPGESPAAALERELAEELAIQARIGAEMARCNYQYKNRPPIILIFFRVSEFFGEPQNRVFEEIRWESPGQLPAYDFLEGDHDFVRRFAGGGML